MFKKVLLSSSVLFGLLFFIMAGDCFAGASAYFEQAMGYYEAGEYQKARELYQYTVDTWPGDSDYAIWSQTLVALSNIDVGQMEAADVAIGTLLGRFSENEHIAEVVHHVAFHCLTSKKYEKARELYQYVLDHWPDDDSCAIWSQTGVAMSSISLRDTEVADAAAAKLLNKFSDNRYIAGEGRHLAWHCRYLAGDHTRALRYYQYVVDHWPGDEKHAAWSQGGIALSYIDLGNSAAAQAAIDKLFAEFSGNEHLAEAVDKIAYHYRELKQYEKAIQYYQYILDHWPGSKYAMWSQTGLALLHIDLGNSAAAQATINKLLSDFSGNEGLVEEVHHIAYHYRQLKNYEKAKQYYQYVLDHWPEANPYAIWSQSGIGASNAGLGETKTADAVIEKLFTDFSGHPDLAEQVLQVGEPYYDEAFRKQGEGLDSQAKEYFRKALAIHEIVKNRVPGYVMAADTCCWTGASYRALGEYEKSIECYQKVVDDYPSYHMAWNAQFIVGRNYEELKKSGAVSKSEADTKIKAAYEQLLENDPDCPAAKPARDWLSRHK